VDLREVLDVLENQEAGVGESLVLKDLFVVGQLEGAVRFSVPGLDLEDALDALRDPKTNRDPALAQPL